MSAGGLSFYREGGRSGRTRPRDSQRASRVGAREKFAAHREEEDPERSPSSWSAPGGPRLDPRQVLRGESGGSTLSASASRRIARGGGRRRRTTVSRRTDDPFAMEALLSHCVRSDGERLDPALSPAPSVLRGTAAGPSTRSAPTGSSAPPPRDTSTPRSAARSTPTRRHPHPAEASAPPCGRSAPPRCDFEPRVVSVSPSGHFAAVGGLRHAKTASRAPLLRPLHHHPRTRLAADTRLGPRPRPGRRSRLPPRRRPRGGVRRHPSVRVLRAAWHPSSDGHLVVLLSDGTLRVFDAAAGPPRNRRSASIRGDEDRTRAVPARPEIVDFAFAPPHGWGAPPLSPRPRGRRVHHVSVHAVGGEVPARHHAESHAAGRRRRALAGRDVPDARGGGGRRLGLGLDGTTIDEDGDGDDVTGTGRGRDSYRDEDGPPGLGR